MDSDDRAALERGGVRTYYESKGRENERIMVVVQWPDPKFPGCKDEGNFAVIPYGTGTDTREAVERLIAKAIRNAEAAKPAPAPGAEAAIEALGLTDEEELTLAPIPTGWWAKRLRPDGTVREAVGDTLSAALAALRGEAK